MNRASGDERSIPRPPLKPSKPPSPFHPRGGGDATSRGPDPCSGPPRPSFRFPRRLRVDGRVAAVGRLHPGGLLRPGLRSVEATQPRSSRASPLGGRPLTGSPQGRGGRGSATSRRNSSAPRPTRRLDARATAVTRSRGGRLDQLLAEGGQAATTAYSESTSIKPGDRLAPTPHRASQPGPVVWGVSIAGRPRRRGPSRQGRTGPPGPLRGAAQTGAGWSAVQARRRGVRQ